MEKEPLKCGLSHTYRKLEPSSAGTIEGGSGDQEMAI
jgi:hypothetical protein